MDLIKKNPKTPAIVAGTLIAVAILIILAAILVAWRLTAPRITIVKIGPQKIQAEIVRTPTAMYRGLSGRPALDANRGMLFDFRRKQNLQFVMRDMKFPLDIIFIADKKIVKIATNLPPEGHEPAMIYSSDTPADQVLEVNGGYCERQGISVGDSVSLIE